MALWLAGFVLAPEAAAQTLSVSPTTLAFEFTVGGKAVSDKELSVTSSSSTAVFQAEATPADWLRVNPTSTLAPAKLVVSVDPGSLAPGTYTGKVRVWMTGAEQTVVVTLTVKGVTPTLVVSPSTLAFTYTIGDDVSTIASQSLAVSGKGSNLYYSVTATGAVWITLDKGRGLVLPGATDYVSVNVNPTGLAAGSYKGTINLTLTSAGATGAKPSAVAVTLTVSTKPPTLDPVKPIDPTSAVAGAKDTTITVKGENFFKTSKVRMGTTDLKTTYYDANTLTAVIPSKTLSTAGPLEIAVFTPAPGGGTSGSATFMVLPLGPLTSASGVVNAASYLSGPIAPGEVVTIFGTNLGPATLTPGSFGASGLEKTVSETSLTIDSKSAPLLYVQANQISAIVPYGITTGGNVPLEITYRTTKSTPAVQIPTAATAPALFTLDGSGKGQAAAYNEDWVLNTSTTRADRGEYVSLYLTGAGNLSPAATDGAVGSSPASPTGLIATSALHFVSVFPLPASPVQSKTFSVATDSSAPLSLTAAAVAVTPGSGTWLTVSPTSGVTTKAGTPATLTVTADPSALPGPGVYYGTITVTSGSLSHIVAVTFTVGSTLTPSATALAFFQPAGATSGPGSQALTLSLAGDPPQPFTTWATTNSGGNWLSVSPAFGSSTAVPLTVSVTTTGLSVGTYRGTVGVASAGATNSPLSIAVTLTLGATLSLSPASMSLSSSAGSSTPVNQTLTVTGLGGSATNFNVAAVSAGWLSVSPTSGSTTSTTPASITVTANPTGLAAGTYAGSVEVTPAGLSKLTIPVTLVVAPAAATTPSLGLSAGSLAFLFPNGATAPATQSLAVTGNGASPAALTAAATVVTPASGAWLSVSPGTGNTPATFTVSANPFGLSPGTYLGTVSIAAPGPPAAVNNPQTIPVTLTVSPAALPDAIRTAADIAVFLETGSKTKVLIGPVGPGNDISYIGPTSSVVNGVLQMNVRIPTDAPTGPAVPIAVSVGGVLTQTGVTIAVNPSP